MNDRNIKYETISNGIKCSYTFKEDVLNDELNNFIGDKIKELNELVIRDKNEEYIRLLLNRINKAIEYIENNSHYYNADGEIMFVIEEEKEEIFCKELLKILKGERIK